MTRKTWPIPWVVLLVVGAFLAGCSDDDGGVRPSNGSNLSEITVPFAVGNTWVYATDVDTSTIRTAAAETSRVVGTKTSGDETYYVLENVTLDGTERVLVRQAGQDILTTPVVGKAKSQDPFQDWMDQITAASLPWKIADFDAHAGCQWVEIDAQSQFTLGGSDVTVRYEVYGKSHGRCSINVPAGDHSDAYHGEFTTRLTLMDALGEVTSGMALVQQYWIADGVGTVKEVLAGSAEMDGGGYTVTKTSELSEYELQ
ncbi:hypothetical protein ACFL6M_06615 [Candidatus Eisenbacteria bacterium]|uniref:Lipoprotein n=1 Tax=Eiseniibacteriota bacterium TaxID=2212470 RepID=A0ABV6YLQ0_UNCEI